MVTTQYSYTKDTSIWDVAANVNDTPSVKTRTLKTFNGRFEVENVGQFMAFIADRDKMTEFFKTWGIGRQSRWFINNMADEIERHLDKPLPTAADNPQNDADYKILKLELIKLIAPAVVQGSELDGNDVAKFCISFADTVIENLKDEAESR